MGLVLLLGEHRVDLGRLPWATLLFGVACLSVSLLLPQPPLGAVPAGDRALQEAVAYWGKHAYLAAEPEILIAVGQGLAREKRLARLQELRDAAYARWPSDSQERAAQQQELDLLTTRALATESAPRPLQSVFIPANPTLKGFFLHPFSHPRGWSLAGNLLFVLLLGSALERIWLWSWSAGFYLLAIAAPPAFYLALAPHASAPSAGALGVTAALLGGCLVAFHTEGCRITYPLWRDGKLALAAIALPVWSLAGAWLLVQAALWYTAPEPLAHPPALGGLLLGIAAGIWLPRAGPDARQADRRPVPEAVAAQGPSVLDRAREARRQGDDATAFALLRKETRDSSDPGAVREFWDVAVACGRPDIAARPLLRLIELCVGRGELADAARDWLLITELMPRVRMEPPTLARLAPALATLGRQDAAMQALETAIHPQNPGLTADALQRVFKLAREWESPEVALRAARLGLERSGLGLEAVERARLRDYIAEIEGPEAAARAAKPEGGDAAPSSEPSEPAAAEPSAGAPEESTPTDEEDSADLSEVLEEVLGEDAERPIQDAEDAERPIPGGHTEPPAEEKASESAVPERRKGRDRRSASARRASKSGSESSRTAAQESDEGDDPGSDVLPRFSGVKAVEGTPETLGETALVVRVSEERTLEIGYDKVQAIAAAGILGLVEGQTTVLIDLVLNWNETGEVPLRVVRLRGDRFDPRSLVGDGVRPAEAYRVFLSELLSSTEAFPLPDENSARGRPMRVFESLDAYHAQVLDADPSS